MSPTLTERNPSERPVNIDTKFVKTYTRRPFDDCDELVYVLTWADGEVTERYTIPNEWSELYVECVKARQTAAWVASINQRVNGRTAA
jgi:hypothetical protein